MAGNALTPDTANLTRTILRGASTGLVYRGATAIAPLIVLPVALEQLGVELYAAWAAAITASALLGFADLGIGATLMTRLSRHGATGEAGKDARGLVSSGVGSVAGISLLLAVLAIVGQWLGSYSAVLNAPAQRAAEVDRVMAVSLIFLSVNVTAALIIRLQYAFGRQATANLWQLAGTILMVAFALATTSLSLTPALFVAGVSGIPVLTAVVNSVVFFSSDIGRQLRPSIAHFGVATARELVGGGLQFFTVSLLLILATSFDPVLVARIGGLKAAADFSVAFRIFNTLLALGLAVSMPLWPVFAKAIESGNSEFVLKKARQISVLCSASLACAGLILLAMGDWLIGIWLNESVRYIPQLWTAFLFWIVAQVALAPYLMIQNAVERLRPQILAYCLFFVLVIPLKILVASTWTTDAVPAVNVICFSLTVVPVVLLAHRRMWPEIASRAW